LEIKEDVLSYVPEVQMRKMTRVLQRKHFEVAPNCLLETLRKLQWTDDEERQLVEEMIDFVEGLEVFW
jgi:hypothetical protein